MDLNTCACSGKTLARLVQPAVMAVLAQEPLHGYLVMQRLGAMGMFKGQPPDGTGVYRMLKAMEVEGLVASTWELADNGPAKRRFELSAKGRACLGQWSRTLQDYAADIDEMLDTIERVSNPRTRPHTKPRNGKHAAAAAAQVVAPDGGPASSHAHGVKAKGLARPFVVDGERVDELDLKVLLLNQGMSVAEEVYKTHGTTHRISADPYQCSTLLLPDKTVVHIANIGPSAPFELCSGPGKRLHLLHDGKLVTEVALPKASAFYQQTTSRGLPFRGLGVLQGRDVLVFPYLWPCDYAKAGQACRFCHCGNITQQQWASGNHQDPGFTARDVAEAVHFAVNTEKSARYVQLTGGSTFHTDGEIERLAEILQAINQVAGLKNIPGEVLVYTTPPSDPKEVDALFAAGADRVACDLEVWDEKLARQISPGKTKWTGRQRHLDTLLHIAKTRGPGKALSTFVVGLEPAERFLAGAEYLAANGVVPIPSVWMPHGLPALHGTVTPDLAFFRKVRRGLAAIYQKHNCQPPGDVGFNVCLCRDTWNHRAEILVSA